ncbi:MAG TPA: Hsp20/alpha crystallin family protein [Nocardioidaceae bacterium]|nr:Hsp20/alpha crystallin family protein [Nocardioidaceae bacterium]
MTTVARRPASPMAEMLDWLESYTPFTFSGTGLAPYVRIEDFLEQGSYVLRAELPGIDPEKDVEVSVDNDMLTITGERREEIKEKARREFHYGSFRRSVSLPKGAKADQITAEYTDGVLEVRVPIDTAEQPSVKIPVQRHE